MGCLLSLAIANVGRADVTVHNGTIGSGGTGAVDVYLDASSDFQFVEMDYLSGITPFNMTLVLDYDFETGQPPVFVQTQRIINSSTLPWAGFSITLELADFYEDDEGLGGQLAEGELTVSDLDFEPDGFTPTDLSMTLTRDMATRSVELEILFGGDDMEFDDFFDLRYWINRLPPSATNASFTMYATPILSPEFIPAPGAAVLAMLGLACVGCIRRRVR